MRFNSHWKVEGKHALLGASKYHWVNYDDEKMQNVYFNLKNVERGNRMHSVAAELIRLKIRQARNNKTFNMYVNDAIGWRMEPEQILYYSDHAFGTADTISFDENKQLLRIHDLKTGTHKGSPMQVMVYFAYFCLEYGFKPHDVQMKGRLYQSDEVLEFDADPDEVEGIMKKAIHFSKLFDEWKEVIDR